MTSSHPPPNLESIVEICPDPLETDISIPHTTDSPRRSFQWLPPTHPGKTTRAFSCHEDRPPSFESNSRLRHLCNRLKRRFSFSKESQSGDVRTHRAAALQHSDYKPFSSSFDHAYNDFEWPDFEELYDAIPTCLAKALPGLDDLSLNEADETSEEEPILLIDETDEQWRLFQKCKRGRYCRRNAICPKLDKSLYKGQLNTFIQQLMIEKLMRTWT